MAQYSGLTRPDTNTGNVMIKKVNPTVVSEILVKTLKTRKQDTDNSDIRTEMNEPLSSDKPRESHAISVIIEQEPNEKDAKLRLSPDLAHLGGMTEYDSG